MGNDFFIGLFNCMDDSCYIEFNYILVFCVEDGVVCWMMLVVVIVGIIVGWELVDFFFFLGLEVMLNKGRK